MRVKFIELVYLILARIVRVSTVILCLIFNLRVVIMDGTRINPLWLVPEYLLRRRSLYPEKYSQKIILIMAGAANSAALNIIRQYFLTYVVGFRIFKIIRLAFPVSESNIFVERVKSSQYKDVFQITNSKMSLPPYIEKLGNTYCKSLGMSPNDWFVCFVNRDPGYLETVYPGIDWSYHDYRNSSIENCIPAMKFVVSQGGWSIRLGSVSVNPLPENLGAKIIDYADKHRTEELDLFLLAHCRLFVVGNTGLSAIASSFGRPCAFTNLIPLAQYDPFLEIDQFIPKLLMNSDGRFLTFDEMLEIGIFSSNSGAGDSQFYNNLGISPIENEAEDIRAMVEEMLTLDYQNIHKINSQYKFQLAFKERYFTHTNNWKTDPNIAASFLMRHSELMPSINL